MFLRRVLPSLILAALAFGTAAARAGEPLTAPTDEGVYQQERASAQGVKLRAEGAAPVQFERSDCAMDSRIFVSGSLLTGHLSVRHEAYDGSRLGALRFAERYSASFRNEFMGVDDNHRTAPRCVERSIDRDGLPLRAVVCLRAYKKLEGLHDLSVLVATLDGSEIGVQGRFDARGVSLASAQRLTAHYLDGFAWSTPKNDSR